MDFYGDLISMTNVVGMLGVLSIAFVTFMTNWKDYAIADHVIKLSDKIDEIGKRLDYAIADHVIKLSDKIDDIGKRLDYNHETLATEHLDDETTSATEDLDDETTSATEDLDDSELVLSCHELSPSNILYVIKDSYNIGLYRILNPLDATFVIANRIIGSEISSQNEAFIMYSDVDDIFKSLRVAVNIDSSKYQSFYKFIKTL